MSKNTAQKMKLFINPFVSNALFPINPMHPFFTPWKHQKRGYRKGYRKGAFGTNGLMISSANVTKSTGNCRFVYVY